MKDHIKDDLRKLAHNGVNAIVLAVSEYEAYVWFDRIKEIIEMARLQGMKVYWNFWAWGGIFGGEATSKYLQDHIEDRQVDINGKKVPAVCPSSRDFREYIKEWISDILSETEVNGFFWDEPHFYGGFEEDTLTCYCEKCKENFMREYGKKMPIELTKEFAEFRENTMLDFLKELLSHVKKKKSSAKNIVCLLPDRSPTTGIYDWKKIANLSTLDVISTDPYWSIHGKDLQWYKEVVEYLVSLGKANKKKTQIWLQLFMLPKEEIKNLEPAVDFALENGVDSIFAWPIKAAEGQFITSEAPQETWKELLRIYNKIRRERKL